MRHYIIREDRLRDFLERLVGNAMVDAVLRKLRGAVQIVDLQPDERVTTPRDIQGLIAELQKSVRPNGRRKF